jgi:hypothetical protein
MDKRRTQRRRTRNTDPNKVVHTCNVAGHHLRGTAHQIADKCEELAQEYKNDLVMVQTLRQHAEHYTRIKNDNTNNR